MRYFIKPNFINCGGCRRPVQVASVASGYRCSCGYFVGSSFAPKPKPNPNLEPFANKAVWNVSCFRCGSLIACTYSSTNYVCSCGYSLGSK